MWLIGLILVVMSPFIAAGGMMLWDEVMDWLLITYAKLLLISIAIKMWWKGDKETARAILKALSGEGEEGDEE